MELRRRTPCIRRRLWQTHSRDRRALAVRTPTQPPQHLLLSDRQLTCPVFVLLEASSQQDALFPLPVNVLPMAIHPFFMFLIHPGDLILQVIDDGLQLFNLPLQSRHLVIVVVELEGQIRVSTKKLLGFPPTCAMFPSINLYSCSPIAVEYLIALVAPSLGLSITSWSRRPQFRRWNNTLASSSTLSEVSVRNVTKIMLFLSNFSFLS